MKEKVGQLKEWAGKLSRRTIILIIAGAAALIIGAVAIAFVLNNRPYEVLFSGLGEEEFRQITDKLVEDNINFRYEGNTTILVRSDIVDRTKASLVQEGYPKNGFTYDTFINNAGMMTTDSDKATYKLYELQDRIGATIRLFDGVKDAKVTIALGEENPYVLSDTTKTTASVVVVMENGGSPSAEQVTGIQRLVAKSIPDMELEDVVVLDGNGNDVSVDAGSSAATTGSDNEELARVIENQVISSIMKVLGPVYGAENVAITARAQLDMESLVRESITYNTPEKINEQDKTGIVQEEELYRERAGADDGAGGVAGTEQNADTPEYNTDGTTNNTGAYSEKSVREYLVNQIKEQGQVPAGVLDDLTVSVAINGQGFGTLREDQLRSLIGNAAGIAAADQATKITVVSAPFNTGQQEEPAEETPTGILAILDRVPLWVLIAGAVLILLLIVVIVILVVRGRKRKKELEEEEEAAALAEEEGEAPPVLDLNQELQEVQNDRGMELKRSIREFAEQNAEISAQLLRSWLNGGDGDGE